MLSPGFESTTSELLLTVNVGAARVGVGIGQRNNNSAIINAIVTPKRNRSRRVFRVPPSAQRSMSNKCSPDSIVLTQSLPNDEGSEHVHCSTWLMASDAW